MHTGSTSILLLVRAETGSVQVKRCPGNVPLVPHHILRSYSPVPRITSFQVSLPQTHIRESRLRTTSLTPVPPHRFCLASFRLAENQTLAGMLRTKRADKIISWISERISSRVRWRNEVHRSVDGHHAPSSFEALKDGITQSRLYSLFLSYHATEFA
ncbi:hypothetical protein V8E53_001403 [Lactarius tabidus]